MTENGDRSRVRGFNANGSEDPLGAEGVRMHPGTHQCGGWGGLAPGLNQH